MHTIRQRYSAGEGASMAGLHFERFAIGRVFEHEIRRTVTAADNIWFCSATCNPARIHIDADYWAGTEFEQPLLLVCKCTRQALMLRGH